MKLNETQYYNLRLEIETKQKEVEHMVYNIVDVDDIKEVERHLTMLTALYMLFEYNLQYRTTLLAELML